MNNIIDSEILSDKTINNSKNPFNNNLNNTFIFKYSFIFSKIKKS